MRKSNTEHISTIIRNFLRDEGLETPYNQYKLLKALEDVLGHGVSRFIGQTFIRNQTLHVEIKSPILRQEFTMKRKSLTKRLNEIVGAQIISDIHFY